MTYPIYKYSDDFTYLFIQEGKDIIHGIPMKYLTEEEKREIDLKIYDY